MMEVFLSRLSCVTDLVGKTEWSSTLTFRQVLTNLNNNKTITIKEYFRIEMSRYGKKIMTLKKETKL